MILTSEKQKIKYIAIGYHLNITGNAQKLVDLKDYILVTSLGSMPTSWHFEYTYYNNYHETPGQAYAVYLGDVSSIRDEINKKLNPNGPNTFTKVFFDPCCKYPRFKLSSVTNIKRCLDPSKADSVIIRESDMFKNYICKSRAATKLFDNTLILYSEKENTYYIIDYYPEKLSYKSQTIILQSLISKYATVLEIGLERWASALINSNVLPKDCKEFYNGKVVFTYSNEETQFINNLFTKYKFITYDTELDRFISTGLRKPTDEDLQTLQKMFRSKDSSVVNMGLKLLSSYDLTSSVCAVGTIIANNWENIRHCSASQSTGFKQVLNSLKIDSKQLAISNPDIIINALYKNSVDEEDKRQAKDALANRISEELMRIWNEDFARKFHNFNFTFKFTIE